ncbi:hypothetical protein [Mycobacterium persicum]|uniref:hypothetical protein n=1 Tax=Mycobacterium persicum TaxID=1487726 RepID=UPI0013018420|nr:hypothetical protein [Mycobacterium persicum]
MTENIDLAHQVEATVESCGSTLLADPPAVRSRMGFNQLTKAIELPTAGIGRMTTPK